MVRRGHHEITGPATLPFCRQALGAIWLFSALALAGCGGGGDDDSGSPPPPKKPDTGYGKAQSVPNPPSCADLCARLGDCVTHLCDEDTQSTRYDGLAELFAQSCTPSCTTSALSAITPAEWQCMFQDSCRQVFDYDSCQTKGYYTCQ